MDALRKGSKTFAAAMLLWSTPLAVATAVADDVVLETVITTAPRIDPSDFDLLLAVSRIKDLNSYDWTNAFLLFGGLSGASLFSTAPAPVPDSTGIPQQNCQAAPASTAVSLTAHPVVIAEGRKVLPDEVDFVDRGEMPLSMVRMYGATTAPSIFGHRWRSGFDRTLRFEYTVGSACERGLHEYGVVCSTTNLSAIFARRPDGGLYRFNWEPARSRWEDSKPTSINYIVQLGSGNWVLHTEGGGVETYKASGVIESIVNEHGIAWTFNYSGDEGLQSVTHSSGRSVQFSWGWSFIAGAYRVSSVVGPDGQTYGYSYTPANLSVPGYLYSATSPGGGSKTYHYELGSKPWLLTGVSLGSIRRSNFTYYYADERVQTSALYGPIDSTSFAYGTGATANSQLTRAGGLVLNYQYQDDGAGGKRLWRISRSGVTQCPNANADTVYDANGFIDYTLDWKGNKTDLLYNAKGQLLEAVRGIHASFPGQERKTVYEWNPGTHRLDRIKTYGASTSYPLAEIFYEYYPATDPNAPNRLYRVTATNKSANGIYNQSRVTSYTYQRHANNLLYKSWIDGPIAGSSDATVLEYSSVGDLLKITAPLGHASVFAGHNNLGLPATVTDPNGVPTTLTYDSRGRVLTSQLTVEGVSRLTQQTYTAAGQPNLLTRADGTKVQYGYNNAGLLTGFGPAVAGAPFVQYTLDANGNRTERAVLGSVYWGLPPECFGPYNPYPWCYDQWVEEKLYSESFGYDQLNRLTSNTGHGGQNPRWKYDNNDNPVEFKDALNRTTTMAYNSHDELVQSVNALNQSTYFSYDAGGRVASVSDPRGQLTSYVFDGLGNLVSQTSPDTGTTSFTYDEAGRRTSMTRQNGALSTYSYDALSRLMAINAGGQAQTFTYDSCLKGVGRLCQMSDSTSGTTVSYTYNEAGELASETSTINVTSYAVSYAHNKVGGVTSISFPATFRCSTSTTTIPGAT